MLTHPTNYPTNSVRKLRNRQTLRNATFCHFLMFLQMLRFSEGLKRQTPTVSRQRSTN